MVTDSILILKWYDGDDDDDDDDDDDGDYDVLAVIKDAMAPI